MANTIKIYFICFSHDAAPKFGRCFFYWISKIATMLKHIKKGEMVLYVHKGENRFGKVIRQNAPIQTQGQGRQGAVTVDIKDNGGWVRVDLENVCLATQKNLRLLKHR